MFLTKKLIAHAFSSNGETEECIGFFYQETTA